MTQEQAWNEFNNEILPQHERNHERRKPPNFELRRSLYEEWISVLVRDGHISESDVRALPPPKECYGPDEIALFELTQRRQKRAPAASDP